MCACIYIYTSVTAYCGLQQNGRTPDDVIIFIKSKKQLQIGIGTGKESNSAISCRWPSIRTATIILLCTLVGLQLQVLLCGIKSHTTEFKVFGGGVGELKPLSA